jgi:hypothetical protein
VSTYMSLLVNRSRSTRPRHALNVRFTSSSGQTLAPQRNAALCHVWTAPAVQEKNLTFPRIVRVQPCIRPLNAAVLAAGPDVIR